MSGRWSGLCRRAGVFGHRGLALGVILLAAGGVGAWDADLDLTFDLDGRNSFPFVADGTAYAVAVQPDGKLVVGGWTSHETGATFAAVARFQGDEDLIFADDFESRDTAWWGDWGP
jgi:hypothetical protein